MALLHQAELRPSKLELVEGWAQSQPWFEGDARAKLTNVASFRVVGSGTRVAPALLPSIDEVSVRLDGGLAVVDADTLQLVLLRVLGGQTLHRAESLSGTVAAEGMLTGTWAGRPAPQPLVLAFVR